MPFIDIELLSLIKIHMANNDIGKPNEMVSTPIDTEQEQPNNKFFGDYYEYSSDEEPQSLFTKSAPQINETDSSPSVQLTDDEEQNLINHKRHHKSVTFAASPLKTRINTVKEKKKVCRMLFYASKITKRPSSFLKKRKQRLAEVAKPEIEKQSKRKLKVFFCYECGMKIYTMSNSNTHLVTEL